MSLQDEKRNLLRDTARAMSRRTWRSCAPFLRSGTHLTVTWANSGGSSTRPWWSSPPRRMARGTSAGHRRLDAPGRIAAETWAQAWMEVDEIYAAGEDRVVSHMRYLTQGNDDAIAFETQISAVLFFTERRVTRRFTSGTRPEPSRPPGCRSSSEVLFGRRMKVKSPGRSHPPFGRVALRASVTTS